MSRRWIIREVENSLRRLGTDWIDLYQIHRPDPETDIDETLGALTDLVHQGKVRYIGPSTFPAGQIVEAQWAARDRQPAALRHRAAALLDARPRHRGRRAAHRPAPRHGHPLLQPARRRLAVRPLDRKDSRRPPLRANGCAARFDMSLPENQRKLDAVEQLAKVADDAGLTLIELAIAFVVNHPAITSAIIGPRTMEQLESQLTAADVTLDEAVLDRIDEIVRPAPPSTRPTPATANRCSTPPCAGASSIESASAAEPRRAAGLGCPLTGVSR